MAWVLCPKNTVQLGYDDTLRTVDDERTLLGHIGNRAQINVLHDGCKILMVRIGAIQLQLGLEGHTVGLAALQTLLDGVAGRIDVIVQEFENEVVARVGNGEILCEHFVETLVVSLFRRGVKLQEVLERLELHLEEIGVRKRVLYRRKIYAGFICFC